MKRLLLIVMSLTLIGCQVSDRFDGKQKSFNNERVIDVSFVNVDETTYDDIVAVLGIADQYIYEEDVLDPYDLPSTFFMYYDGGVSFWIDNNQIIELRISSEKVIYDDKVHPGQTLEEALEQLSEPIDIVENTHLYFLPNVLYKNFKGDFVSHIDYYHDEISNIRIWAYEGSVENVYYVSKWDKSIPKDKMGMSMVDSYTLGHDLFDSQTYTFEDDPALIGTWLFKDWVYDVADFDFSTRRSEAMFTDLIIEEKGNIKKSHYIWTKGLFINVNYPFKEHKYEILFIEGQQILMFEMFGGWLIFVKT